MREFTDLNDACKGLLLTTARVLNGSGLNYVVAGGWVPVLSELDHPELVHPGTRDVDVLLMDDLPATQVAVRALLADGFNPSAKHEFQLLQTARVGDKEFVFNVDLMHPLESSTHPDMFCDIFDLGVRDDYDPRGSRYAKSIAFKSSAIVYEQELFSSVEVQGRDLSGEPCSVDIPILSPAAAILSKCESVKVPKRTRDAYDIFWDLYI